MTFCVIVVLASVFRTEHELKEFIAATFLNFFEKKLKCTHRMLKLRTNQYHNYESLFCLWFSVPLENFSFIWRHHHDR